MGELFQKYAPKIARDFNMASPETPEELKQIFDAFMEQTIITNRGEGMKSCRSRLVVV